MNGGPPGNGGAPIAVRRAPGEGMRRGAPGSRSADPTGSWRPLPEPALASPGRPAPARTTGRLASLAPDPEPQAAARPAPAAPRTAQDFAPDRVMGPVKVRPATRGVRRTVRTISFGLISPGPGRAERRERELIVTTLTPISTCRRVAIVSRKGGIGKTTTTLMLGHTFATHRMDRVVALDAEPRRRFARLPGSPRDRRHRHPAAARLRADPALQRHAQLHQPVADPARDACLRRRPHHQRGPRRARVPPGAARAGAPLQPDPDGHGHRHPRTRRPRACCGWPTRSWSARPPASMPRAPRASPSTGSTSTATTTW